MTAARLHRRRRSFRVFGTLLLFWPVLVAGAAVASPSSPTAAPSSSLGGYSLIGRATAVRTLYDTPGSLPVGPLFEVTAPEAQASLVTGPFGSALSSTTYPGPLVEGGPALLATQGLPTGEVPPYPVVVRASSSGPPEAADEPAPGTRMYAHVDGTAAEALSTLGATEADALLSAGGSRSAATSVVDGPLATASAVAEVSDVVALGGVLRIESVRSELESSSDATAGRSDGRTVVQGATLAGAEILIDENGVSFVPGEGSGNVLDPLTGPAAERPDPNELLSQLGISIRVAEPEERVDGATVSRVTEGLVIAFDQEIGDTPLDELVADLPFPAVPGSPVSGPADLVTILTNRQVSEISIGRAAVTAGASPGFEQPSFAPPSIAQQPSLPASPASAGGALTPDRTPASGSVGGPAPTSAEPSPFLATSSAPSPLGALGPTTFIGLLFAAAVGSVLLTAGTRKLPDWALDGTPAAHGGCPAPTPNREETLP